jgi:heterodisulfide reductase subunit C
LKNTQFLRIVPEVRDSSFLREVMGTRGGENILDCIQCGVCGGSCHARFAMDYSPMQIIKMIHLGMREKALSSSTIWICASCYTCSTRCPRGIDIPMLMSALKNMAIRNGVVSDAEIKPKFHKIFTEIVGKYGRMYEPELKLKLLRKNDLREIYVNAVLAFKLWRKGKVRLSAPKIHQLNHISKIFENQLKEERGEERS